ncbi:arginine deiminase-related protein [Gammaproteobacteria bacterium]|nr:arginine deiminase-related protein [Gammaproteobacteria bacterium]MDC0402489.1 arginine deiminase-related protein [Gammaproteobacteria bacterium]
MKKQSTNHIFMIEPEVFYSNEQTIDSNHYQLKNDSNEDIAIIKENALREFHNLKKEIEKNNILVKSMKGIHECPDHIFPNWFITFDDKTFQLFSMNAENRRLEKTTEMINYLSQEYTLTSDLSEYEEKGEFLEATSSMVFDRVNRVVYAAVSPRTNKDLTIKWCKENDYELVLFDTNSHKGSSIYHTDVLMYVGQKVIGICFEVILPKYRDMVRDKVSRYHDIFEINESQIKDFCGNSLEAHNDSNEFFLIMSSRAFNALSDAQKNQLSKYYKSIIHTDLTTIEKYGGGSARCMLNELF